MSSESLATQTTSTPAPLHMQTIHIAGGIPVIRVLNLLFLIITFIINGLGNNINNTSTRQLSEENPNFLTPANYAFSIWGLIYLFLAVWGIYQVLPRSYNSAAINNGIGYVFLLNAIANCTWIFVFGYRLTALSAVFLALILTTNLIIYLRLKLRYRAKTWIDTLCIHTGFSLYTAWTLGAAFVNLWLASTTRDVTFIEETISVLVILGVIEIWLSVRFNDPLIAFVGAWTLLANYIRNMDIPRLAPTSLALTIILLLVGVLVSAYSIYIQYKSSRDSDDQGVSGPGQEVDGPEVE